METISHEFEIASREIIWFPTAQLLFSWNRIIRCWIHVQGFQIKITKTDCRAVWKRFFQFEFFGKYGCCLCRTMFIGIGANFCSDFFVQIGIGSPAFMGPAMSAVELQRRTNNFDLTHLIEEKKIHIHVKSPESKTNKKKMFWYIKKVMSQTYLYGFFVKRYRCLSPWRRVVDLNDFVSI